MIRLRTRGPATGRSANLFALIAFETKLESGRPGSGLIQVLLLQSSGSEVDGFHRRRVIPDGGQQPNKFIIALKPRPFRLGKGKTDASFSGFGRRIHICRI